MHYLEIQPRPVKIAAIVSTKSEIFHSVRFLSAIWGGGTSLIFPTPKTNYELEMLKHSLSAANPDITITLTKEISKRAKEAVSSSTAQHIILNKDVIDECTRGASLRLRYNKTLPSITSIDISNDLNHHSIIGSENNPSESYAYLQAGIVNPKLQEAIKGKASLDIIKSTEKSSISLSMFISNSTTVRSLFKLHTGASFGFENTNLGEPSADYLWVYLYKRDSIATPTTFWNRSAYWRKNRLIVSYESFTSDLSTNLSKIALHAPNIKVIRIVTELTEKEATAFQFTIESSASGIFKRRIEADVFYDGLIYTFDPISFSIGRPHNEQVPATESGLVRFNVRTPPVFRDSCNAYGLTIRCTDSNGKNISLPNTEAASKILTYGSNLLSRHRDHPKILEKLYNTTKVHATDNGIGTITSDKLCNGDHEELGFFIPEGRAMIEAYFAELGYNISLNAAAHYAESFLRRISPLDFRADAIHGLEIPIALMGNHLEPSISNSAALIGQLQKRFKYDKDKSKRIIDSTLPKLLQTGVIRRGYSLECRICQFRDWYALGSVAETFTCNGCGVQSQTQTDLEIRYKVSEITISFFKNGGQSVINCIWLFNKMANPGQVFIGGEIAPIGKNKPIKDFDVVRIATEEFAAVECKDWFRTGRKELADMKQSGESLINAAKAIGADCAYLCIHAGQQDEIIKNRSKSLYKHAIKLGIDFRLILNQDLYTFESTKGRTTIEKWAFDKISIIRKPPYANQVIGKKYRGFTGKGLEDFYTTDPSRVGDI